MLEEESLVARPQVLNATLFAERMAGNWEKNETKDRRSSDQAWCRLGNCRLL